MAILKDARDEVYVRMENDLTRCRAVVHDDIDAVGLKGLLNRARHLMYGACHGEPIALGDFKDIRRMLLGDDQRMTIVHGIDVEKRNRIRILKKDVGRNFLGNYFAENTILHTDSVYGRITLMAADLSPLILSLLERRGFAGDAAAAFLAPNYDSHTHPAELLADCDIATARTLQAMDRGERIAVYADFDCDGIPGAALLHDLFAKLEYSNVEVYIPHRDREGYGFHREAIDSLVQRGVTLIITVDVGTTAVESIAYAKEQGVDVIVTDHHEILGELPQAIAILNPKREPYPFPHLCGTGVAFKFAQALINRGRAEGREQFVRIPAGWEKWLLDLVAIATVADMVSLVGENRALVHWGLAVLRKTSRPGIAALCLKIRLRRDQITEEDIGFSIAPRINAASRMDEPMLAWKLLTTRDHQEAQQIAVTLESLNSSRKGVVGGIVKEAKKRVADRYTENDRVIVLGDPEWKPALLGLAANSIVGEHGGVVCLWGRDALGRIKGSCRSDGSVSVVKLFESASESFEEYGGHAASGGFTLSEGAVHTLPQTLAQAVLSFEASASPESAVFDALVSLREITMALWRDLSRLSPFGLGNPKPVFRIDRVQIESFKRFGKEKNHVEIMLTCPETGARIRAYDFFRSPEGFSRPLQEGMTSSIIGTIERDAFRGGVSFRLVDVLAA